MPWRLSLLSQFDKAIETGRLSQSFEEWSEDYLEQVAVSWVLACVFVRFLEDNHLIDECWIADSQIFKPKRVDRC